MTTNLNPESTTVVDNVASKSSVTAGQLLREARLKAGVHLAILSVTLKVPVRQLEALEADDLDLTKGAAFYRGLASGVCRHLNADPAPVLALLPQTASHMPPMKSALAGGDSQRVLNLEPRTSRMAVPGKVFWGAALMLLLTGALLWLPGPAQWAWLENVQAFLADDSQTQEEMEGVPINQLGESAPLLPKDGAVNDSPPVLPTPVQVVSSPSAPTTETEEPVVAKTTAQGMVEGPEWVFNASQDSWLEVRDGKDAVIWSGIVKAGESRQIQNSLPVNVVVGRAGAVVVTFRGQPFDLKPHTRSSVARFEVKE